MHSNGSEKMRFCTCPIFLHCHHPLLFLESPMLLFQAYASAGSVGLEAGSVSQPGKVGFWKPGLSPHKSQTGIQNDLCSCFCFELSSVAAFSVSSQPCLLSCSSWGRRLCWLLDRLAPPPRIKFQQKENGNPCLPCVRESESTAGESQVGNLIIDSKTYLSLEPCL